jgi:Flp pilus assembly pilin Flp
MLDFAGYRSDTVANSRFLWLAKLNTEESCAMRLFTKFHKEESGQDLIEYALIGLLIALGAIAGMTTLASSINHEFTQIAQTLT